MNATHCKIRHQEHKAVVDILIHSNPLCLFVVAVVKHIFVLDWENLLTMQKNVTIPIIYIAHHVNNAN
jgi:hypothetical protein